MSRYDDNPLSPVTVGGGFACGFTAASTGVGRAPALALGHLNKTDIGRLIQTDNRVLGILLAPEFRHVSRDGRQVGPVFDYFAASIDLHGRNDEKSGAFFSETLVKIAALRGRYGGEALASDDDIHHAAVTDPALLGFWHLPTRPLLDGLDVDGRMVQRDNLLTHRDTSAFAGTFHHDRGAGADNAWYWSNTRQCRYHNLIAVANFPHARSNWLHAEARHALSARLVRGEVRGGGGFLDKLGRALSL